MKSSFFVFLSLLSGLSLLSLNAQTPSGGSSSSSLGGLDVSAKNVDFDRETNTVTATGDVVIRKGDQSLAADKISYNVRTEEAYALGNVVFTTPTQVWRGPELRYNFISGVGDFPAAELIYGPFRMKSISATRVDEVQTSFEGVTVTTCLNLDDPDFAITASQVDVFEGRVLLMRNPVFKLHGIPFFWWPRYSIDLDREPTGIEFLPGYSSRDGAFLLSAVNVHPSENFRMKSHVDLRSERGIALGQQFIWSNPETKRDVTRIRGYYAFDNAPYSSSLQEEQLNSQGIEIPDERYWLYLKHNQRLQNNDAIYVKANYVSDERILQDFFPSLFDKEAIPENRAVYSTSGPGWTANLELTNQLNDDLYSSVNRLPEATLLVPLRSIGNTPFLYETESRAGFLQQGFSENLRNAGAEEYETLRLHTDHVISYPYKTMGWLNLIPRAGFGLTYYSETFKVEEQVTSSSETDPDTGIITTNFSTNNVQQASSGDMRLLPELGLEASFKAFGLLSEGPTSMGTGVRHVVEPFANYTLIPEPDLTPSEIYQFDEIDSRGEQNNVAFGIRNKFQTRRPVGNGRFLIHDLVNFNIESRYDLRSEADPALGSWFLDLEIVPTNWLRARFDTEYNADDAEIRIFDTEFTIKHPDQGHYLTLDQRFRVDSTNTFQFRYGINPKGKYSVSGYSRYESEEGVYDEQELLFKIRGECVGYGIGFQWQKGDTYSDGTSEEDEYELWLQIWLTAFPKSIVDLGGKL